MWFGHCGFLALDMYSLLSWATIVKPLSALFIISVGLLTNWLRACRSCLVKLSVLFVFVFIYDFKSYPVQKGV